MLGLLVSCSKDQEKNYKAENDVEISTYISKNNIKAEKTKSGLYYIIEKEGSGAQAGINSYVNVSYKGYLLNGSEFDKSDEDGIFTNLQQVITGWSEGISYFKEGGSGKLFIPAHLAYGSEDRNGVPGGSVLIFDIQLIEVFKNAEAAHKVKNEKEIRKYLLDNKLNAQKTESGLYYIIEKEGAGSQPTANSEVTVVYKGYFINGTGFDQTKDSGTTLLLNNIIKGWAEGISYFKEGGEGKLIIPAHLAYGSQYLNGIPGGSVLIFDIKLLKVK